MSKSNRRDKRQQKQPETQDFVAHVYAGDYHAIKELVQQYPNIETGGDLFGLWQDERTVVIQLFIGPGKKCERTTTSFYQDVDYLHKVGSVITTEEGLCNVGEWHSHHQIGMPGPSGNDCRTVFSNMPHLGLERFVLFIASIESKAAGGKPLKRSRNVKLEEISLHPYLFLGPEKEIIPGKIKEIPGRNPYSFSNRLMKEIETGKEPPRGDFKRKVSTSDEEVKAEEKEQGGKECGTTALGGTAMKPNGTSNEKKKEIFKKGQGKENLTRGGDGLNNENVPPNRDSATPGLSRDHFPPSQGNTFLHCGVAQDSGTGNQGTSPSELSGLWHHWDNSLQRGSGIGRVTSMSSSSSQMSSHINITTQPTATQQRRHDPQRSTQSSGGVYTPSSQSWQDPRVTQQGYQGNRGRGQRNRQHQSPATPPTSQGQASGYIPIGQMTAKGSF